MKVDRGEFESIGKMWNIWQVSLFSGDIDRVLILVDKFMVKKRGIYWIATVNPEFMMEAENNAKFKAILQSTSLNVVDGVGLVWAKKVREARPGLERWWRAVVVGGEILKGKYRDEMVAGADLMEGICQLAAKKGWRVAFFGGWEDRAIKTAKNFKEKYQGLKVVDARAEDYDFKKETDILLVARGMRKQEEWIEANFDRLKTRLVMGVGRCFDYFSGDLKRAPILWRKMGLEWLYSLIQEPKRWRRQMALPKFIWRVLTDR